MKRIVSLIITICLILSCLGALNVSAAGKSVIKFNSKEVTVGDEFTVTVNVSADENMMAMQFALQYDPQILEFVSGDSSSGGAGVISVVHPIGNASSASLSYTFKAVKAGSCYVSTSDLVYVNFDESEISVPNQGSSVTVKDVTLSDNADLKSLKISDGKLSPSFSSSATSYSVTVEKGVTDCKIYATADDKDAKVQVSGGSDLKVGKNKCTVTVTAANGTQKTYNIVITRKEEVESKPESSSEEESSEVSSEESSSEESSSDESSSDESSSDEESSEEETSSEEGTLETQVDGVKYTVAENIDNVNIPLGFTAKTAVYNGNEVAVITDENEEYVIFYLSKSNSEKLYPYLLNPDTVTFEKLQYLNQNGRYYIFCELPSDANISEGYYMTSTYISDFNVECYSDTKPELSAFYYAYCFNGEEYGFYRYDSAEKVLQRYPELTMNLNTEDVSADVDESFAARFASLTTNAKIIVVGILLVIIGIIALVILLALRIVRYRNGAKYDSDINYLDDFDDVNFVNKFSLENEEYLTDKEDVTAGLDFGDDIPSEDTDIPDYLIDGEPESGDILPTEENSGYLTDDESDIEEDK